MIRPIIFIVLACYSLTLIVVEWQTSQDYVRHFFTDIEGARPLYAINTTLSVALLWATALMFAVCLACTRDESDRRLRWFFWSQLFVFGYLGVDDRFKFHETLAVMLDVGDHYVLALVAAFEVACLFWLGRIIVLRRRVAFRLVVASGLFAVMLFVDACLPHDLVLRLSIEDLAKTWAAVFFLLFAWEVFSGQLRELKARAMSLPAAARTELDNPSALCMWPQE